MNCEGEIACGFVAFESRKLLENVSLTIEGLVCD
jgi:hypothetical protein